MTTANWTTDREMNTAVEDIAAELAEAAYPVLLRNVKVGNWLDLELELWRRLKKAVGEWAQEELQDDVLCDPLFQQKVGLS
jgi:hypothetical protein